MTELEEEILKPQKINIVQLSMSLFEIVRRVETESIRLQTQFKRYYKWDNEKKSKLIESIILNIPIQPIYLSEESDHTYEVLDGQQRIITILEFINNKFKLKNIALNMPNLLFIDLDRSTQRKIQDYTLTVFIIGKDTDKSMKYQIFERINTGTTKLNSQEMRSYLYRDNGIPFINQLAEEEEFKNIIKYKNVNTNSMQDQELVLRFMSFYYKGYEAYNGNLKRFLNDTLENYDKYRNREKEFRTIFIDTMRNIYYVFGDRAFLIKSKSKINIALFEILTYSFSKGFISDVEKSKDLIKWELYNLIEENQEFKEAVSGASTTTKSKTLKRFRIWEDRLRRIREEENDK